MCAESSVAPKTPPTQSSSTSLTKYREKSVVETGDRELETSRETRGTRGVQRLDRVEVVQMICRCPDCKAVNHVTLNWRNPPIYRKCQSCGELIPTDGFIVLALSNDPANRLF